MEGNLELKDTISIVGHRPTDDGRIWISPSGKTMRLDCGCGFECGRLGVIRLNDGKEFYTDE